jgi:hypothetical protein
VSKRCLSELESVHFIQSQMIPPELEERPVDKAHILRKHQPRVTPRITSPRVTSPRARGDVGQRVEELETELKKAHREIRKIDENY